MHSLYSTLLGLNTSGVYGSLDAIQFESPGLTGGIGQLREKDSKASTGVDWGPG